MRVNGWPPAMRIFPELTLAAMVAGVGLALWSEASLHSSWPLLMLALAGFAVAVGLRALRLPTGPVILAAALLLGFWRGHSGAPPELPIVPEGPASEIVLLITDAPVPVRSGYRFPARVLPADGGAVGNAPDGANLLVYALPPPDLVYQRGLPHLRYGDTLRVSGRVEHPEPIGDFDYAAWLASRRISAVLWVQEAEFLGAAGIVRPIAVLHSVRSRLAGALQRGISAPQSALAQALLLGIRGELPEAVKDSFRAAGMSHLLAISGLPRRDCDGAESGGGVRSGRARRSVGGRAGGVGGMDLRCAVRLRPAGGASVHHGEPCVDTGLTGARYARRHGSAAGGNGDGGRATGDSGQPVLPAQFHGNGRACWWRCR